LLFLLGVSAIDRALKGRKDSSHFKSQISRIKKTHHRSHSHDYAKSSPECDSMSWADWMELGTWRPSDDLIHGFFGRTMGTIFYQPITEGWGDVNMDLYEVEITTLPNDPSSGSQFTSSQLFTYWRLDIAKGDSTQFVDTDDCSFKAFDDDEANNWAGDAPTTTYITIHLARLLSSITQFSFDDGSVMCTQYAIADDSAYWTFSVIHSARDGGHPVSGNRRFGFYQQGTKTIFYTKGVDRVTTWVDRLASAAGQVFENADKTWISMQDKLVAFVNANGGVATKRPRTSVRCDWDTVWASWTEPCDARHVIEIDGGCHTTNLVSCDDDGTCEPNGDSPCAAPGTCKCGTLLCYCGRPAIPGKVCDPWS